MKKIVSLLAVALLVGWGAGTVFAHCGHCGISDGYVCAADNVAQKEEGKCGTCGADLVKGDVKEVTTDVEEGGQTVQKTSYVPAPAHS